MTVFSASDIRYLPGLFVTWGSILLSSRQLHFEFYLLHDGIPEAELKRFESDLRTVSKAFALHSVELSTDAFADFPAFFFDSRMTYARLMIPRLVPTTDRALYIDTDIVVLRDLSELDTYDLKGDPIAVVKEWGHSGREDLPSFYEDFPATKTHQYFNAGLLLLDLKQIRESGDFDRCLLLLKDYKDKCRWWDQTALNVIFAGRCAYLDTGINYQIALERPFFLEELSLLKNRAINLHYLMGGKPWIRPSHSIPHRVFRIVEAILKHDHKAKQKALSRWPVAFSALLHRLFAWRLQLLALLAFNKRSKHRKFAQDHAHISSELWQSVRHHREISKALNALSLDR